MMIRTLIGVFFLGCLMLFQSCGEPQQSTAAVSPDLNGFISEPVPNSNLEKVVKKNQSGKVLEEGFMLNGLREGTWVTFHPTGPHVKSITTYAGGKRNGIALTFTNRGQVEKTSNYKNDLMNGYYAEFKYGNPLIEATYVNNLFHGEYKEYYSNKKMAKRVEYVNGKIHGKLQTFNDQEKMTTDYVYENGEKISGGIVD